MKRINSIVLLVCLTFTVKAQFSVAINGKKVTASQEFNYADLKSVTVSFSNPLKLPTYSDGYVILSCGFYDGSGLKKNVKYISKKVEGAASINAFLNQKTPKTYSLYPKSEEPELFNYLYNYSGNPKIQFADMCENYRSSPDGEKVKLKFELEYRELTGWHYGSDNYTKFNDYGEPVELVEPFEMFLKIADKNTLISISTLNAKFKLVDFQELGFEKIDTTYKWDNLDISGNATTSKPKKTRIDFKGNNSIEILNLKYPGNDSQNNLKDFLTKCDQTVFMYANKCIKLNYFVSEAKRKKMYQEQAEITKFGLKDITKTSDDRTWRKFNEKLNENARKETIWQSFKVGGVSGYKALNKYESSTCYDKNNETGRTVIYACIHPNDPNSILIFVSDDFKMENANYLTATEVFMEKFIAMLKFTN